MRQSYSMSFQEHLDAAREAMQELHASRDVQEGHRAFVERRHPRFRGE